MVAISSERIASKQLAKQKTILFFFFFFFLADFNTKYKVGSLYVQKLWEKIRPVKELRS